MAVLQAGDTRPCCGKSRKVRIWAFSSKIKPENEKFGQIFALEAHRWEGNDVQESCSLLFFVLCSYIGRSHHQADACHLASVYRGFCSIWNTHFCLRLQPHLYPVPVATSVGRSDGTRQRYKSTHVEPDALVRTRNYCRIKVSDRQRWTHIENPTRLNVIDPDWDYMIFLGNNSPGM